MGDGFIVVALCLVVYAWLTTEHFPPWVSWHSEVAAFAAVGVLCWVALARAAQSDAKRSIEIPWLSIPFLCVGLIGAVQVGTSILTYSGDAVAVALYLLLCLACLILGFNDCGVVRLDGLDEARNRSFDWLATTILVGAAASAVICMVQVFGLWPDSPLIVRMPELRRPGGNIGQPNQMATLLVMGVASVAYLFVARRLCAWVSGLLLVVLGIGLAATESRTGVIDLVVLMVWWQLNRSAVSETVSRWAAPLIGTGFLLLFLAWPLVLTASQILDVEAANRFTQGDVRLAVWAQLIDALWQHPFRGWGLLQVPAAHNAVADANPVSNPFSYSHNLLLDLAIWMGLPIATILVASAGVWLWRRCRRAHQLRPWFALAVALPLTTHSMLEFPFAYAYFLAPVMYLLGAFERISGAPTMTRIDWKPAAALAALVTGVLAWSAVEYLSIEEDFRIVRFEQMRIGKTPDDQPVPHVVMFTQLGALLTGSRLNVQPDMSGESLQQLKSLALRYPWVATQYRYALALALNGDQPEAVRQLKVIRAQRDEMTYRRLKRELSDLANTRYPQLKTLNLP